MLPLFADTMNAGMTPAEFAEYQKLGDEATQAAIDQLQAQRHPRHEVAGNNARSRMLKQLQRCAKAQRAEMRAMARMDVLSGTGISGLEYHHQQDDSRRQTGREEAASRWTRPWTACSRPLPNWAG